MEISTEQESIIRDFSREILWRETSKRWNHGKNRIKICVFLTFGNNWESITALRVKGKNVFIKYQDKGILLKINKEIYVNIADFLEKNFA